MKTPLLTSLLLVVSLFNFGQTFPKEKTEDHVLIKNTHVYMIPPTSFEISSNFWGFQNSDDPSSMIVAAEVPEPYSDLIQAFNPDLIIQSKKEVVLAGYEGLFLELNQTLNGVHYSAYLLAYGNENFSGLINGIYLKDDVATGELIKKSLMTTFIDPQVTSNPRDVLDYTLDETVGSLQFNSSVSYSMVFHRDLKDPEQNADRAALTTNKILTNGMVENKALFCTELLNEYPGDFSIIESKGIQDIELDGLKGYALFAENKSNEEQEAYQVVLFDDHKSYYVFIGTYLKGSDQALNDIQKVIHTFKRK